MPPYEPDLWGGNVGRGTNCYDYAADHRADPKPGGSQPGHRHGHEITIPLSCLDVATGAIKDGFRRTTKDGICDFDCWKVALFMDSRGKDYHWYRQDDSGNWSHKRGNGPVLDYDATNHPDGNGNPITDPERANRNYGYYNYSIFCDYFCCCKSRVDIASAAVVEPAKPDEGLAAAIAPIEYNVTLSEPAKLSATGMSLVLPPGELRIVYAGAASTPAGGRSGPAGKRAAVQAMIRSGFPDPNWLLAPNDQAALEKLADQTLERAEAIGPILARLPGFLVTGLGRGPVTELYAGRAGLILTLGDGSIAYRADQFGVLERLLSAAGRHDEADDIVGSFSFP